MRRRRFLVQSSRVALGTCLFPLVAGAQDVQRAAPVVARPASSTLVAELEKLIPKLMELTALPGLSIALVEDGRLSWRRGFGVKDAASKAAVDNETLFEAASVSKTVFAYAVMKLCEQGVLELDTPLTKYTPMRMLEDDPRLELITARHVLSHTSGFQDWRSGQTPLKIHFTPGEKFQYSGEGYYYLQSVLTHLRGKTDAKSCAQYEAGIEVCATDIDSYLKRNLLTPFGMVSSGYVWNEKFTAHAARPHDLQGKPLTKSKPRATDAARYASAGGLHTTPTEYAKFLIEVIAPKAADAFRLKPESLKEMLRPHVKLDPLEKIDGADSWALGWAVQQRKTGDVIVHSGGQSGFRSLAMASVARKSGFIILTNGDSGGRELYDPGLMGLLDLLLAS